MKIQSRIEHRPRSEHGLLCGISSNSQRSFFTVFRPSFEAEASRRSSNSPFVSSSPHSPRKGADPGSLRPTGASGSFCREYGRDGKRSWSLFSPKPSSAGIARDSGCTGEPFRSVVLVGLRFQLRCRPSLVGSQTRTAGAPEKSGLNSRSLGSPSAFPLSLDISRSEILTTINASGGGRSFAITATASPRWTSWSFPPFGSDYCMSGS